MQDLIIYILIAINILLYFNNNKNGRNMYLFLSIVAPVLSLGGGISYDIIFFPLFIFFEISIFRLCKKDLLIIFYLFIYILSTFISSIFNSIDIMYVSLFGTIRFAMLLLILSHKNDIYESLIDITKYALIINFIIIIGQYKIPIFSEISYNFYMKESSLALKSLYEARGAVFSRCTGTFNNIAPAGFFFLISYMLCLFEPFKFNKYYLMATIFCGFLTTSKLFIIGLIIGTIIYICFKLIYNDYNIGLLSYKQIILFSFLTLFLLNYFYQNNIYFKYYFDQVLIGNVFTSRYSASDGVLMDMFFVFKKNYLIGIGATNIFGEFVGDSTYISLLHSVGIIGTTSLIILGVYSFYFNYVFKNLVKCIIMFFIFMSGFAVTLTSSVYAILCISVVISHNIELTNIIEIDTINKSEM